MPPPSSESRNKPSTEPGSKQSHADFLLGLFSDTEDEGANFLRNVSRLLTHYKALRSRRHKSLKLTSFTVLYFLYNSVCARLIYPED
jgi:hypothetical protein